MAHSKQAFKRIRQSEKKKIRARSAQSEIKTLQKSIADAVARKDDAQARALLTRVLSRLDKAAKIHIYHRNAVDRRKSKLSRLVNSIAAGSPSKS